MNPYRKDENCQECLKRREKTPMLGKTRQLIHILVLTLALGDCTHAMAGQTVPLKPW